MIDLETGRIAYAVLSFGGFLGMGDKLFAIPWSALALDTVEKRFILNVEKELLKHAPGFDKDHWPNMADHGWGAKVFTYYGDKPYWNKKLEQKAMASRNEVIYYNGLIRACLVRNNGVGLPPSAARSSR